MTSVELTDAVMANQYRDLGLARFRQNRFIDAITAFEQALRFKPDDPYARYNRATALLSAGDYGRGFQEYEWTWRLFHWKGFGPVGNDIERLKALPLWQGEYGARVLVYHELGHGDAIMALRFLAELKKRATITLLIDAALQRLVWPFDVPTATEVPRDLGQFAARLPLFSAMAVLGTTVETIPREPYIAARWRRQGGNRIGIAWSGRTQTSFTLERFKTLFSHDGYTLHALQPGPLADDEVEPLPPGSDFLDVARRIETMDHVVSVDTAAVHLAGAMGHSSSHLVLPYLMDWRWWRAGAWYPTLKTYRQDTPDDWATPFAKLNAALAA